MYAISFFVGGLGYMGLELLWRGRTHWSMGCCGGLCTAALFALFRARPMGVFAAWLFGALVITAAELLFGLLFNRKRDIWDYSKKRLHFRGQICPAYSLLWGVFGMGLWAAARLLPF